MSPIEQKLVQALRKPFIIPSTNPKSERTMYMNARNNVKNKALQFAFYEGISILHRQKFHRIIIGPKDFQAYLPFMLSLETVSEVELQAEWEKVMESGIYPLPIYD